MRDRRAGWGALSKALVALIACAAASACEKASQADFSTLSAPGGRCPALVLIAHDRTHLGMARSNVFDTEGVCNRAAAHGGPLIRDSIYNPRGPFGSPLSEMSAYHPRTLTPPWLVCAGSGQPIRPVSKNSTLDGAVDPDRLCVWLRTQGY